MIDFFSSFQFSCLFVWFFLVLIAGLDFGWAGLGWAGLGGERSQGGMGVLALMIGVGVEEGGGWYIQSRIY